jgi:hypothetical protein
VIAARLEKSSRSTTARHTSWTKPPRSSASVARPCTATRNGSGVAPASAYIWGIVEVGCRPGALTITIPGGCSSNGSKDAVSSSGPGWTRWDARDGRPWPGRTRQDSKAWDGCHSPHNPVTPVPRCGQEINTAGIRRRKGAVPDTCPSQTLGCIASRSLGGRRW